MNAKPITPVPAPRIPRFDAEFVEEHQLVERYLERRLPFKGARELEIWCRENPEYLDTVKLSVRTAASIELLEACGRPLDLAEPRPEWWKSPLAVLGLAAVSLASLLGFWVLFGKYALLQQELDGANTRLRQGPLQQPPTSRTFTITPDRDPGMTRARMVVDRATPQLIDLHLDMNYSKNVQFRLIVDKQGQGRALIVENLLKDSNGELRLTFNTTGLAAGIYGARIEALPFRSSGSPSPAGWLQLEVR